MGNREKIRQENLIYYLIVSQKDPSMKLVIYALWFLIFHITYMKRDLEQLISNFQMYVRESLCFRIRHYKRVDCVAE